MNLSLPFISKEYQLRVLIDSLPDYIYFKDLDSRFVDANKATLRIMGVGSLNELIGKTDFDFYPSEFAKKFFHDEREILASGRSKLDYEETIVDEHKRGRVLSTSKVVLRDEGGKPVGLVGIGKDITERKQAEEVLRRDKDTLEKLVKKRTAELLSVHAEFDKAKRLSDIGTFAAMVAHDLRNPLAVIKVCLHNLMKDKVLRQNENVVNIQEKVVEGNRIIDNLLTYSHQKAPRYELVRVAAFMNDCIKNCQVRFCHWDAAVETHYDGEVGAIEIDPHQMKEVFLNILNNAMEALPQKTGKIRVVVQKHEEWVSILFQDNGVGIPDEDMDKIFIPFFTSKRKGTGLGLAVSKEIVNLHGGFIEVKSLRGVGSEFNILLPIRQPVRPKSSQR